MKELKNTQTEKNLMAAFAGESQARNKYTFFASAARKEGYENIARIFESTADQEKEHAKIWLKYLSGIGSTKENLQAAADGEDYEYKTMYKDFARIAREEGFDEIAAKFEGVGNVENEHKELYEKELALLKSGEIFKKKKAITWECLNCGHDHKGTTPPEICPICSHPKAYFTPSCDC